MKYSREQELKEMYYNLISKRTNLYYRDVHELAAELAGLTTLHIALNSRVDDAGKAIS